MKDLTIAVVGATGAVGTEFLRIMEQRHPKAQKIKLLASHRSAGKSIRVNGRNLIVEETSEDSFRGVDIAFISVSSEVSRRFAPIAVEAGAVIIDDGSAFRMDPQVPLVVPEVNGDDVEWHRGIISIPNCSTTPLAMVAHALRHISPIKRIIADTYQSVSGAGGAAMVELREQTRTLLDGGNVTAEALPNQIGFNVFPHIDSFLDNGYTREEQKMIDETRKIMHAPDIAISATCVRVPVYVSHSAAVHFEFEQPVTPDQARGALSRMPGVRVMDDPIQGIYPTPWAAAGEDDVLVGRIRCDVSHPNGLALWVVSDNLRKGAALNSIQIAEELVARNCLKPRPMNLNTRGAGTPFVQNVPGE
jgi:aspartate-semialdehyde dehydrogenase